MTSVHSYTPLEEYLIFQSLTIHGVQPEAFDMISSTLKHSALLQDAGRSDNARLDPGALERLYLDLLKVAEQEEVQSAIQSDENGLPGDGELNSRKRKAPSPTPLNAERAGTHSYLIPQLAAKLYATYRNHIVRELREDERRYDILKGEAEHLDIQQSGNSEDNRTEIVDTSFTEQRPVDLELATSTEISSQPTDSESAGQVLVEQSHEHHVTMQHGRLVQRKSSKASIDAVINHDPPIAVSGSSPHNIEPAPRRSSTVQPHSIHSRPPTLAQSPIPYLHSSQSGAAGHRSLPAPTYQSSYAPMSPWPALAPSPSRTTPMPINPPQSSSPVLLPPPSGFMRGMPQSHRKWSPSPDTTNLYQGPLPLSNSSHQFPNPNQQYWLPPVVSHDHDRQQISPFLPRQPLETWMQATSNQPYSGYPPDQSSYHSLQERIPINNHPPSRGGVMLPPFQVALQDANLTRQTRIPQALSKHSDSPLRPTLLDSVRSLPPLGSDIFYPHTPLMSNILARLSGPSHLYLRRPGVAVSPGSTTGWKWSVGSNKSTVLDSPSYERELSPPPQGAEEFQAFLCGSNWSTESLKTARGNENQPKRKVGTGGSLKTRGRPPAGSRLSSKASLAAPSKTPSAAPSSSRGRTQSQSIASHADELSLKSAAPSKRSIKNEPTTPAAVAGDDADSMGLFTTFNPHPPGRSTTNKRKRSTQDFDDFPTPASVSPSRLPNTVVCNTVVASRNFAKITGPLMNNISSHKHASIFANPVRERNAEGYKDIIRRPQDLKTIRAAIIAGSRAVAAATAADVAQASPSSFGSSFGATNVGGTVTLPWSADLIPPKGIVNGAQLEQEIMRMFANAVMFNPGNGGVVREAREMFEEVEQNLGTWRAAERAMNEEREVRGLGHLEDEADELAAEQEASSVSVKKRRPQ